MQTGEYIRNRLLPDAVRLACQRQDIDCASFSDDWVLQLAKGHRTEWIFGYKFSINNSAVSHLAQDKVATYEVLRAAGLSAVPHMLVRSVAGEPIAASRFEHRFDGKDVVVKPLIGTGGRGVQRYATTQAALAYIGESSEPSWAMSPYLDIISETRLVVLEGTLLLAYEKQQPELRGGLKLYNLSHGAVAVDIAEADVQLSLRSLAVRTCSALGLRLAAVDIITTAQNEQLVLEVNDGFSMEYYARQSAGCKKRSIQLYDTIITRMFS